MRRHFLLTFALSVATLFSVAADASALPIANAGGPYWVNYWLNSSGVMVGADLLLDGSPSYDTEQALGRYLVTYRWDIDGDGLFDDAIGNKPMVTFAQLKAHLNSAGIIIHPGSYPLSLQVVNDYAYSDTASTTLTLNDRDSTVPVPEPASLLLFGTGLVGLRAWRKRRQ